MRRNGRGEFKVIGPIALVGGAEWRPPARPLDEWLLDQSGSGSVTILPTAAANERPEKAVEFARGYFEEMGAEVQPAMILQREQAEDPSEAERLRSSSFIYIAGGDPRHLAKVMRGTAAWQGILDALSKGSVLAASSAGAMLLCERMIWPGNLEGEDGLGYFKGVAVVPHHDLWQKKVGSLLEAAAGSGLRLLGIDECTGLVVESGRCRILGAGSVTMYERGELIWSAPAPAEMEGECL